MVLSDTPDPKDAPCPKITPLQRPEVSRLPSPSPCLHRRWGEQNNTKPQFLLQSRCLPLQRSWPEMQAARLIGNKLQVQRKVIRRAPSGSLLPFMFHFIKPKERELLSIRLSHCPAMHVLDSLSSLGSSLASFHSSCLRGLGIENIPLDPISVSPKDH